MRLNLARRNAILTGANGGLGVHFAAALSKAGMNLLLVAYPGIGLEDVQAAARKDLVQAEILVAELRVPEERTRVVETAMARFGSIDLLVNNAGVEFSSTYHDLDVDRIRDVINVNLEAPMMLTRLALPHMLRQRRGHIVNISSLAGKSGPGHQEPYVATKAGLSAFTLSLRNTYRGTGVSASVITPGFVEAGIYSRLKVQTGRSAPIFLGVCSPQKVCAALLRAVRDDVPEIIVNRYPIRPVLALTTLFPAFGEWMTEWTGTNAFFKCAHEASKGGKG